LRCGTVSGGSPAEFEKLIVEESEKWAKDFVGIKANDRRRQL